MTTTRILARKMPSLKPQNARVCVRGGVGWGGVGWGGGGGGAGCGGEDSTSAVYLPGNFVQQLTATKWSLYDRGTGIGKGRERKGEGGGGVTEGKRWGCPAWLRRPVTVRTAGQGWPPAVPWWCAAGTG